MRKIKYWASDDEMDLIDKLVPKDADDLKRFILFLDDNHITIEAEESFVEIRGYSFPNFCFYPKDRSGSFGDIGQIHFDLLNEPEDEEREKYKKHLVSCMHSITKSMSNIEDLIESLPLEQEEAAKALQDHHAKWWDFYNEIVDKLIAAEQELHST